MYAKSKRNLALYSNPIPSVSRLILTPERQFDASPLNGDASRLRRETLLQRWLGNPRTLLWLLKSGNPFGFAVAYGGKPSCSALRVRQFPTEGNPPAGLDSPSHRPRNWLLLTPDFFHQGIACRFCHSLLKSIKYEELLWTQSSMFGGLTGLTNSTGTDWGERLLNTVASKTIRHMFTQSESVEVFVRCYPSSKLLQGSIDNFKMSGRGLVIRKDFWVEEMSFETDAVAIDFSGVLGGKLSLKQPTQAVAEVTLSEEGINRAFEAELVQKRLRNLALPALTDLSGGEPVSFDQVQVELLPNNKVKILAKADLGNGNSVPIGLTATITVERRRRISFKDPKFEADLVPEAQREISQTLTGALSQILDNMVDLDRFDLDGVTMRINRLETQGKNLIFSGYAQIERIPGNP